MTSCKMRAAAATLCGAALWMLGGACVAATNLLGNPGFDTSLAGWDNLDGRTASWTPLDAGAGAGSGSALIGNESNPSFGGTVMVLTQCISAAPSTAYAFGGVMRVPAEQPSGSAARVIVATFTSGDCSGADAEEIYAVSTSATEAWEVTNRNFTTGPGVHAVLVGLGLFKPTGVTANASGYFDNVYLQEEDTPGGFAIIPYMSGSWFNPAESGHGIMLDLLPGGRAWMCWFAFDLNGSPAWICASGTFSGNVIEFADAFIVTGGKFPPLFDPLQIVGVPWGSITITFTGCDSGTMQWTTTAPGFQSGSMPLARVTSLWGYSCPQ
jgi:hypothetical protein